LREREEVLFVFLKMIVSSPLAVRCDLLGYCGPQLYEGLDSRGILIEKRGGRRI
jgi:hypothetical protein